MPEKRSGRVTLAQVAAQAEVSVGTASKALSGRGSMREETRLRVREIADRLGFQTDAVARSLQTGRGVVDGLGDAGRRVPQDVAMVGFDNWDVMTAATRPPLTSADMDLESLGRGAARLLLAAIGGEARPGVHRHPGRLAIRESTARDGVG